MLDSVASLAAISSSVTAGSAGNVVTSISLRPQASRVMSMLRSMYSSSFSISFGSTWKDCTNEGYTNPPTMPATTQSPMVKAGTRQLPLSTELAMVARPANAPRATMA